MIILHKSAVHVSLISVVCIIDLLWFLQYPVTEIRCLYYSDSCHPSSTADFIFPVKSASFLIQSFSDFPVSPFTFLFRRFFTNGSQYLSSPPCRNKRVPPHSGWVSRRFPAFCINPPLTTKHFAEGIYPCQHTNCQTIVSVFS